MDAIILAGGYGTRVQGTESYPKPLHKVYGAPMIEWVILNLKNKDVDRIVLALAYGAAAIQKEITSERYGIEIVYSVEEKPTGTSMAVAHALRQVRGYPVLVANGDTFVEISLEQMLGRLDSTVLYNGKANCGVYLLQEPIEGVEGVSLDEVLATSADRVWTMHDFYDFGSGERHDMPEIRERMEHNRVQWALRDAAISALAQSKVIAKSTWAAAKMITAALTFGGKVMTAGNGGGCAEAMHMAAELTGRLTKWEKREPLTAMALGVDPVFVSAYSNDYTFEDTLERSVRAYARPNDVLVLFSTSGESTNLMWAAIEARSRGTKIVAVTGSHTPMGEIADVVIPVIGTQQRQQELMTMVVHALCDAVERGTA